MHYRTLVILPRGVTPENEWDAHNPVAALLAPWDENIEVPPYVNEYGETCTYNPEGRWDYWLIGGRYSGHLTADERDVFPLVDLAPDWSVYQIVTPDGGWHSKRTDIWTGTHYEERPNWRAEMYEIASAFPACVGVCCDVHS